MTNLLKERYKARLIDNRRLFLAESILKEDFNQETVDKALQAIKQLNSIKWPAELKSFKNATKNAISELKNVLANGGRDKKLIDKII